jgi:energy-coupling factor transport system ATP-binding protein
VTALIQIENLHYRPNSLAPGQQDILRGVDLTVEKGAFVAIIGKNGSGKTTLIKHINGLLLPTRGRILVDGMDTRQREHHRSIQSLVGMVFQNPADQIVASTVEEDVAFGLENLNLPTPMIRARVAEQLTASGLINQADRPPHLLSGGQIQKVALAGVLARQPQVILFDEPTSMLDAQAREAFLRQIHQLHQQGLTILYITHHMEEAIHADLVLVLNEGQIALSGSPKEIFWEENKLYEMGLEVPEVVRFTKQFQSFGWPLDDLILTPDELLDRLPIYSGNSSEIESTSGISSTLTRSHLIDLKDVHYTYLSGSPLAQKALTGVDLAFQQGHIHAIAGANGSGKSTLLQHINGILRPDQGSVRVGSFTLEDPNTKLIDVIRKVGLVFQSPEAQFFEVFVGDEIAYGPRQFRIENLRERVREAMAMVGLNFDNLKDQRLVTLSGGEKRKVALASTLVLDQEIVMFDEPTAGMDPNARDELLTLFEKLRDQGKTIIIASHRMEEIGKIAENLSLMKFGRMIETDSCGQVLASLPAIEEAGLIPPLAVQTAHSLVNKGWPINTADVTTPAQLFSALEELIT